MRGRKRGGETIIILKCAPACKSGGRRHADRQSFKVDVRKGGEEQICQTKVFPPASLEGGDRQTKTSQHMPFTIHHNYALTTPALLGGLILSEADHF